MTDYKYPVHIIRAETANPRFTWCGIIKASEQTEWENIDAAIAPGDNKPEPCLDCLIAIRAELNDLVNNRLMDKSESPEYDVTIHMVTLGKDASINADCTVNKIHMPEVKVPWAAWTKPSEQEDAIKEAAIRKYQELTRVIE